MGYDGSMDWSAYRGKVAMHTGCDPDSPSPVKMGGRLTLGTRLTPSTGSVLRSYNNTTQRPHLPEWHVYQDEAERAGLRHGQIVSRFDNGHDRTYKVVVK